MNPLRITPIDQEKAEEGTWTVYRGVKLKIGRSNNPKFKNIFTQLMKPYESTINGTSRSGALDEETMKDILCQSMSRAMLFDWDDFSINGEVIPFSQENAYSLLYNDADCREFVTSFSNDLENFLQLEEEEIVGKS